MWNTDAPYKFLSFMPEGKRLAYAVSAPWMSVGKNWKNVAQRELKGFVGVSCRELQGVDVLRSLKVNEACHALDPCLLLPREDWLSLSEEGKEREAYAMGYFINGYSTSDIELDEIIRYCSHHQLGLKIVPNQGTEAFIPEQYMLAPSPTSFLSLIRNAEVVFTNSFHAVVFSIVFHKPFVIIPQRRERRGQNVRFDSLLRMLGISPRMLTGSKNIDNIMIHQIDYEHVEATLIRERQKSMEFLNKHLKRVLSSPGRADES